MTNEPARLNVLISGGFSGAYEQLKPQFERTSGIKVTTDRVRRRERGRKTIAAAARRVCRPMW